MNHNDTNTYRPTVTAMHISEMLDEMVKEMLEASGKEEDDLPDASPLQLLSKKDYEIMTSYLKEKYGCLLQYIDENYVALLIALQEYEGEIDLDAKILKHIADNVKHK